MIEWLYIWYLYIYIFNTHTHIYIYIFILSTKSWDHCQDNIDTIHIAPLPSESEVGLFWTLALAQPEEASEVPQGPGRPWWMHQHRWCSTRTGLCSQLDASDVFGGTEAKASSGMIYARDVLPVLAGWRKIYGKKHLIYCIWHCWHV